MTHADNLIRFNWKKREKQTLLKMRQSKHWYARMSRAMHKLAKREN